ncbi:MAG: hypothetical protein V7707_14035 [Motiliproteus sp.]
MPRPQRITDPSTLETLARVKIDSLIPSQQATAPSFLRSANCYQQRFIKCAEICTFHCEPEFIHAILLELDPEVSVFVPQPFLLRIGRRRYTPDMYAMREGQAYVLELKPDGEFDPGLHQTLTPFFAHHGLIFDVVANETIMKRETEALHWLPLIQALVVARDVDTQSEEGRIWQACCARSGTTQVGDFVHPGDRDRTMLSEVALHRLLHNGSLCADLSRAPFAYDTELRPCT